MSFVSAFSLSLSQPNQKGVERDTFHQIYPTQKTRLFLFLYLYSSGQSTHFIMHVTRLKAFFQSEVFFPVA